MERNSQQGEEFFADCSYKDDALHGETAEGCGASLVCSVWGVGRAGKQFFLFFGSVYKDR